MKRILFSILLVLILIPYIVNAAECDTSKVYIESIGIENSTGEVVELEEATAKDKTVNLNLQMSTKDDEILYKVVLKNDSSEDYEINKNSININSDYLEYSLESDNNNIVKANSTKTIYLRVKYSKEVDFSKFIDGVYQDEITMKVNLKSDDTISNPNTGMPYLIIISIILIISGITLIIYKNKKQAALLILLGLITLPLGVKALCSCDLIVDSKVKIQTEDIFKLTFLKCQDKKETAEYTYKIGMTLNEFFNSSYYTNLSEDKKRLARILFNKDEIKETQLIYNELDNCLNSIERPGDENNYTEEELEEIYDNIDNKERECNTNYYKDFTFDEIILSRDIANYIMIINDDKCLE